MKLFFKLYITVICAVIFIVGFGAYSLVWGNPITKYTFEKKAIAHLNATYPGRDFRIRETYYSFKNSTWGDQEFTTYFYFIDDKEKHVESVYEKRDGEIADSYQ